ncbi:MAG: hypothetical protein VKL39_14570 [Leptolyngbyaceae bacterium]|nr:hypothetical protein [Leptolyngbyaceae bacterium]
MFAVTPLPSTATEQTSNPRGDFPGRLQGGGSRNTECPIHLSPIEGLEAL